MHNAQLDFLLRQIMHFAPGTSDILLLQGKPIQVEIDGVLQDAKTTPEIGKLTSYQIEAVAKALIGPKEHLFYLLISTGACDLSYEILGEHRFRVNVFLQRQSLGIVLRRLPVRLPSRADLGLPDVVEAIRKEKDGLVLVTGATGQGKTTTLAAMIDTITKSSRKHILTLEDPIEFVFEHNLCVVNQQELGLDFYSFDAGLRAALRASPKIILVGEIRDQETLSTALRAAETGHLVLGTFHTSSATQTVNSIVGMFEAKEETSVRMRLASSLRYIISQRLLPKISGGRIAAFEILGTNMRIRDIIVNGESLEEGKTLYNVMEVGMDHMQTFDQHLLKLFREDVISYSTAMLYSGDRARLRMMLDTVRGARGENLSDIAGLELDDSAGKA